MRRRSRPGTPGGAGVAPTQRVSALVVSAIAIASRLRRRASNAPSRCVRAACGSVADPHSCNADSSAESDSSANLCIRSVVMTRPQYRGTGMSAIAPPAVTLNRRAFGNLRVTRRPFPVKGERSGVLLPSRHLRLRAMSLDRRSFATMWRATLLLRWRASERPAASSLVRIAVTTITSS
jgi:hypothetical protein